VRSCSPVSAESPLRLSFGNAAAAYELGRPGWPEEVAEVGGLPREGTPMRTEVTWTRRR
jgi:hypothetical protein